jgi:hypothetical protein
LGQGAGEDRADALEGDHAGGVQAERLASEVVGGEGHQAFLEDQARGEADGGYGGGHGRQRRRRP